MKYKELISQMTLEEKAALLSGKNEWETRNIIRCGIPSLFCSDGSYGIRRQKENGNHPGLNSSVPATCFPTAALIANSWDENLGEEIGKALGEEAAYYKVNILLGPGLNIKRSPLCGRNFEYFSEDPYLAGKMAAAYIRGIQSEGVYACPKYFAVTSQELHRMTVDSIVDERTLREIYLTGFEIAVGEGGARAIMTSCNLVNGTYANENRHLLKDILRGEWGFNGIVITDRGGSNDHVSGVAAGSDLEMPAPGLDSARQLIRAVEEQKLSEEEIDACVNNMLVAVNDLAGRESAPEPDMNAHHELARRAASESMVLLKNNDNLLPLPTGCRVAVIGDFASNPRYQGSGSSMVNPTKVDSIADMIDEYDFRVEGIEPGYRRDGKSDEEMKNAAVKLAGRADVVLYFFGLDEIGEMEGQDREHMRINRNQIELLEELAKVNRHIVGVLSGGSSIEMPWEKYLQSILHGYLCGQAGAGAILDILSGTVCPSGKLCETYPLNYEDTPAFQYYPGMERTAEYREGIYVGYRYYETAGIPVRYPFGYGLSYTTFEYKGLDISSEGINFVISNTGNYAATEIAQMYIAFPDSAVFRPVKELKGFARVHLEPGESSRVHITFDDKTFRFWNTATESWEIESGQYYIMVGASSTDIRLREMVDVEGTLDHVDDQREKLPSYYSAEITNVNDNEYKILLGRKIPESRWGGELRFNDAISQMYYAKSGIAKFIWKRLTVKKKKSEAAGAMDSGILFIYNMPFRALAKLTDGAVSKEMAEGIVLVVNGHLFSGLKKIVGGYFRNRRLNREYEARLETGIVAENVQTEELQIEDEKPKTEEVQLELEEAQPEETQPEMEEAEPEETQPEDAQPETESEEVQSEEVQLEPEETQLEMEEAEPEETQPETEEAQPEETQPETEEAQPEETQPETEEVQPEDTKPETKEAQSDKETGGSAVQAQTAETEQDDISEEKKQEYCN